jgi:hypothetical protein
VAKNPILTATDQQPSPFDLSMSDDALVTFTGPAGPGAPGALSFLDAGYMPVNELTIGGDPQQLKGQLNGLFIHYTATGVQHFAASGAPTTADYETLQYEIMGYKGDATFGHAANGTPTVSGAKHLTVLAQGAGTGHLGFGADGGITGEVNTLMQIDGQVVGTLDFSVQHARGDIGHPATGGLTLDGGTLHATFLPLSVG